MATKKKKGTSYGSEQIRVLSDIESLRLRSSMYLPDLAQEGIEHLFSEVLDNSIDEAIGGHAKTIDVIYHDDGSVEVIDSGRGIPCGKMLDGRNALQIMMTETHAGGKFDQGEDSAYQETSGLNGIGITLVNVLSTKTSVISRREGYVHTLGYQLNLTKNKKGRIEAALTVGQWDKTFTDFTPTQASKVNNAVKRGAKINTTGPSFRFLPDKDTFAEGSAITEEFITERVRKMSYLTPGVKFSFTGGSGKIQKFVSKRGLQDEHPSFKHEGKDFWHLAGSYDYRIKSDPDTVRNLGVEVVFGFKGQGEKFSYVNGIPTTEHGSHYDGLSRAFLGTLGDHIERSRTFTAAKKKGITITTDDIMSILSATVRISLNDPDFKGQSKRSFKFLDARKAVEIVAGRYLSTWLSSSKNKAVVNDVIKNIITAAKLRSEYETKKEVQKNAQRNARSNVMPATLSDARYTGKGSELFIVEGLSPSGQIKRVRGDHQGLYCLRGRVSNPRKLSSQKFRENREWTDLTRIIGGVPGKDFNIDDFRYGNVVICADQDAAGATISATLALWFLDFWRPIIESGNLYIAQTPLAIATSKKPLFSVVELEEYRLAHPGEKLSYKKGLGALSEDETREYITGTTAHRIRVNIENETDAEEMADLWFNNKVTPRKERITERSGLFIKEAD